METLDEFGEIVKELFIDLETPPSRFVYHQLARDRYPTKSFRLLDPHAQTNKSEEPIQLANAPSSCRKWKEDQEQIIRLLICYRSVTGRECRLYDHGINLEGCGFRWKRL